MKRLLALIALLLVAPVQAVDEADAPALDARVAEVGHSPATVEPGTQWEGFIQFHEGHNVTDVAIKVCRVGVFCNIFGPLADQLDANTWSFNTQGKVIGGGSVAWGINDNPNDHSDWRVGVQYFLFTDDMDYDISDGLDFNELEQATPLPDAPECDPRDPALADNAAWVACEETHYIAFDMEGRPVADNKSPAVALLAPLLVALFLTRLRR